MRAGICDLCFQVENTQSKHVAAQVSCAKGTCVHGLSFVSDAHCSAYSTSCSQIHTEKGRALPQQYAGTLCGIAPIETNGVLSE